MYRIYIIRSRYAFMDMLESGVGSLSFAESRAHFGLWVLMAQPLHLGAVRHSSTFSFATRFLIQI